MEQRGLPWPPHAAKSSHRIHPPRSVLAAYPDPTFACLPGLSLLFGRGVPQRLVRAAYSAAPAEPRPRAPLRRWCESSPARARRPADSEFTAPPEAAAGQAAGQARDLAELLGLAFRPAPAQRSARGRQMHAGFRGCAALWRFGHAPDAAPLGTTRQAEEPARAGLWLLRIQTSLLLFQGSALVGLPLVPFTSRPTTHPLFKRQWRRFTSSVRNFSFFPPVYSLLTFLSLWRGSGFRQYFRGRSSASAAPGARQQAVPLCPSQATASQAGPARPRPAATRPRGGPDRRREDGPRWSAVAAGDSAPPGAACGPRGLAAGLIWRT